MLLGDPCDCIMDILNCSDTAQPPIAATHPDLLIDIITNHCYHANNVTDYE